MILPCYLAMTAAEFAGSMPKKPYIAWLSCHFSTYHTGLSNIPRFLPAGAMAVLDDSTPIDHHDPDRICTQLKEMIDDFQLSGVLLDFQRPDVDECQRLCKILSQALPCPVGVTEYYAKGLHCPVLLSVPLRVDIHTIASRWKDRELWLEVVLEAQQITVTKEGAQVIARSVDPLPEPYHKDSALHCQYHWHMQEDAAVFTVQRDFEELKGLLDTASKLGVTRAIGLYQQLGDFMT